MKKLRNTTVDIEMIFSLITCLRYRFITMRRSKHGRAIGIVRQIVARIVEERRREAGAFQREEKSRSYKTCSKNYEIAKWGLKHARDTRLCFRNYCVSWFTHINRPRRPDSTIVSICETHTSFMSGSILPDKLCIY